MFAQALPDGVIVALQQIFAEVAQKMKMTDEVRDAAKNLLDGGQNALAHIMDRRQGHTITALDLFQERDDLLGFF
jgi:hypothetical protein